MPLRAARYRRLATEIGFSSVGLSAPVRAARGRLVLSPMSILAVVTAVVSGLLIAASGLHINIFTALLLAALVILLLSLQSVVRLFGGAHGEQMRVIACGITTFAVFSLAGAMSSYAIAAMTTGYKDAELQRIDEFLHFDWVALYHFVAAHPLLQLIEVAAYRTIYVIPVLLFGYWGWMGMPERSNRFLFEFWCGAVVTLSLFTLMPAAGPLDYLWRGAIHYMPDSELCQPELLMALRLGEMRAIDVGNLCGMVSAPSFHTVAGVLFLRHAFRAGPLKWLILMLSTAMILATPIEGTHYLADLILGALVALVVIWAVELAARNVPIRG